MSPLIPARCTRCGHQWQPLAGTSIEDSINVTFRGGGTPCPRPGCGGMGEWLQGNFDVTDGAIQMRSGPQWSWDLVEHLRLGLQRIVDEAPSDPVAAVAEVDADLAADVDTVTAGWSRTDKLTLLGLILIVLQGDYSNVRSIAAAVKTLLQHVADHGLPGT